MKRVSRVFGRAAGLFLLARGFLRLSVRGDAAMNIEGAFDIADAVVKLGLDGLALDHAGSDPDTATMMAARYGAGYSYSADELGGCRPGSLGRILRDAIDQGYDPDFYRRIGAGKKMTDSEWLSSRGRQIHDILHVVTGYPPTILGEVGVFAFLAGNASDYACLFIAATALVGHLMLRPQHLATDVGVFARAWLHGRQTRPVVGVRFEELLDQDLFELRVSLGIPRYGLGAVDCPEKILQGYSFRNLEGASLHNLPACAEPAGPLYPQFSVSTKNWPRLNPPLDSAFALPPTFA